MSTTVETREGNRGTAAVQNGVEPYLVTPRVEIAEDESKISLLADVPGVGPNDATVEFHEGVLTLEGRCSEGLRNDTRPRLYRRRFTLADPQLIDLDKIAARVANGVLRVDLPKAERVKARRIAITAG